MQKAKGQRLKHIEESLTSTIAAVFRKRSKAGQLADLLGGTALWEDEDRPKGVFVHVQHEYRDGFLHIYVPWADPHTRLLEDTVHAYFIGKSAFQKPSPETLRSIQSYVSGLENKKLSPSHTY